MHLEIKQTETFRRWETSLRDHHLRAIIAARLFRLSQGLAGDISPVGQGISELKIHYGPGYRIYFKKNGAAIVLLLCAGDKSTQVADIKKARQLAQKWS